MSSRKRGIPSPGKKQRGRHEGHIGWYVDNDNNLLFHTGDRYIGLPESRLFISKKAAQEFAEKNEVPLGPFVVDANLHPEPKTDRRKRMGEPPIVTYGADRLLNESMFIGDKPDVQALAEQGFVPDDESPNMRSFDNPDARYVGAQARSARVSGVHYPMMFSNDGRSEPIAAFEQTEDGGLAVIRANTDSPTDYNAGYLHDVNLPAYEDDHCIMYFENGVVHRDPDEGPAVIFKNEHLEVYVYHGLFHNPDGPAVISDHMVAYYQNGLLHNTGYPAVVYGTGKREYWEKGQHVRTVRESQPSELTDLLSQTARIFDEVDERDQFVDHEADGMTIF